MLHPVMLMTDSIGDQVRCASVSPVPAEDGRSRQICCIAGYSRSLPYYGEFGLNAGVLLLSLERVRATSFSKDRDEIISFYYPKRALPLGDQDVLNAHAHHHEEHIHVMSCNFNFRSDTACYDGFPVILHGNRQLREVANSSYSSLYKMFSRVQLRPAAQS